MSNRNDLRSQSLDLLRFPLAIVVLIIHTFSTSGFTFHGIEYSVDNMPVLMEVNRFIDGFLRGRSVPIYFFISGFVFFLGIELTKDKYIQKLKNRTKTLLIPYILWNVLAVLEFLDIFVFCQFYAKEEDEDIAHSLYSMERLGGACRPAALSSMFLQTVPKHT